MVGLALPLLEADVQEPVLGEGQPRVAGHRVRPARPPADAVAGVLDVADDARAARRRVGPGLAARTAPARNGGPPSLASLSWKFTIRAMASGAVLGGGTVGQDRGPA